MYIFENKINEERGSKKNLYSPSFVPQAGIEPARTFLSKGF